MLNKIYLKHIFNVFFLRLIYITIIFSSLIFIMSILEELKFFKDQEVGIGYSIFLTIMNLPSVLFEIFPFIILITTQFFFLKFQANSEILIFRNNGINNFKIISFIFLYILIFFILTALLSVNGLNFVTAISAAATSISNVGPGLGEVIGPNGNFSNLNNFSKWILSVGMILGRLELFAVLVLFIPSFWRKY